ncbi:MAG: PEGA domain-containing protein [Opitutaceae bacterium]
MKIQIITLSVSLALSILVSGCATVVRGGSEEVTIQSDPPGAQVKLSTGQSGTTPWVVEAKRNSNLYVTITKDGYKPLETALLSSIDGASLGIGTAANFLFLPIVNDVIDYKTGANYSLKPNPLFVTLIPINSKESYELVDPSSTVEPSKEATSE